VSHLSELLQSGNFVVTAEINPPKGVDMTDTLSRADVLSGLVDAVNLTDHPGSHMSVSPLALAPLIRERGLEAILQVTCRDRNRIAIQGDLLAAHVLGVENVLCLTGDPVGAGDHPEAKTVFDLDSIRLLEAAALLNGGTDMGSNRLRGAPSFYLGAAVNPFASELADEIIRMEEKVSAGAQFFQSQAVFDTTQLAEFMAIVKPLGAPVIAGIILLKSGEMARNMNQNIPGVLVPDDLIAEMDSANDKAQAGIQIAARIIREARDICDGVHIMAIGWERYIPQVLELSGLPERRKVV
jgi:5,10-methylenetetrahydrofolate reductase